MFEPAPLPEVASAPQPELQRTPSSRRWVGAVAVLLAAAVAVSGTLAGGAFVYGLLTGVSHDEARTGYAYVPESMSIVFEARLDLPAGQREELARFLTRFPGFENNAQVEQRLTDMLADAVRMASQGRASFERDIQPWFDGWVVFGANYNFNELMMSPMGGMAALAVIGVSDQAAAETALLSLRSPDMNWTSEDVSGTTIWTGRPDWLEDPEDFEGMGPIGGQAYAVTDDALLLGLQADDVRQALETRAGDGRSVLESTRFANALRSARAGRLGLLWMDMERLGLAQMMDRYGALGELGAACGDPRDAVPVDQVYSLHLRDGRAVVEISSTVRQPLPEGTVREGTLAARTPSDAFLYAEARDVGTAVESALACLRDTPSMGRHLAQVEQLTGELDDLFGWAGDAAVALRFDGTKATGGLLVKATDQARAGEALGQLRALVTAGGGQLGGQVQVRDNDYRGTRIVTFELDLAGLELPPISPAAQLSYALAGDLVVIGIDESFVKAVLDTDGGTGLAANDRFRRALDFAGARSNSGLIYVDVPATLQVIDAVDRASGGNFGRSMRDARQYLDVIDDIVVVGTGEGTTQTVHIVINTRERP